MSTDPILLDDSALAQTPAKPPPPGVIPDFNGPNPLSYTILGVASTFVGLTLFFLGIRTYTKSTILRRWTWDDVTCGIGLIATLIYWIICIELVEHQGFGRHSWNIPLSTVLSNKYISLAYAIGWLNIIAYVFVKLTFFILYWGIFYPFRWLRYGIVAGASVVTGVYTGVLMYILINDTPRPGQTWLEKAKLLGYNSGALKSALALAVFALVTDVYIFILPILGVLRLQLSRKKQFAVLTVFMTGLGACICSSLSIYYRIDLKYEDATYTVVKIQSLAIVELCVGIIITCMPTTSAFLRHVLQPKGLLRSKSKSACGWLRSRLTFTQGFSSQRNEVEKGNLTDTDGPYRHLKDEGPAVNEDGVYNLRSYTNQHTETTITGQASRNHPNDGIHVRTDLEHV
ncbi:MAG: hypothetical protein Q9205_005450 [Flavoplaca limonia]